MPIDMSNKSYALDTRTAGSDEATVAGATGSATQSGLSQGGFLTTNRYNAGINTEGFSTTAVGGVGIGGANSGTINFGLGATDITKLLSDTTSGIGAVVAKQSDAAQKNINDVVSGLQDLAMSKQTDGQSSRDNSILWVVGLGLAALLGLLALGGKRA